MSSDLYNKAICECGRLMEYYETECDACEKKRKEVMERVRQPTMQRLEEDK